MQKSQKCRLFFFNFFNKCNRTNNNNLDTYIEDKYYTRIIYSKGKQTVSSKYSYK